MNGNIKQGEMEKRAANAVTAEVAIGTKLAAVRSTMAMRHHTSLMFHLLHHRHLAGWCHLVDGTRIRQQRLGSEAQHYQQGKQFGEMACHDTNDSPALASATRCFIAGYDPGDKPGFNS
jgi:hypothetical protein